MVVALLLACAPEATSPSTEEILAQLQLDVAQGAAMIGDLDDPIARDAAVLTAMRSGLRLRPPDEVELVCGHASYAVQGPCAARFERVHLAPVETRPGGVNHAQLEHGHGGAEDGDRDPGPVGARHAPHVETP